MNNVKEQITNNYSDLLPEDEVMYTVKTGKLKLNSSYKNFLLRLDCITKVRLNLNGQDFFIVLQEQMNDSIE